MCRRATSPSPRTRSSAALSTAVPDGGQRLDELALGARHLVDGAEDLGVHGRDSGDDADGGRRDRAAARRCGPPRGLPSRRPPPRCRPGAFSSVSGTPSSLLNERRLAAVVHRAGQDRGEQVLHARLADRAGDADHPLGQAGTGEPTGGLQRGGGVGARRSRWPRAIGSVRQVGGRAVGQRGGDELVAVALGHDRHEQLAGRAMARESWVAPSTTTSGPSRRPPAAAASSAVRSSMRSESRRPPSYTRPMPGLTAFASSCCSVASRPSTRCRASRRTTCCAPSTRTATTSKPSASPATATGSAPTTPSPPSIAGPASSRRPRAASPGWRPRAPRSSRFPPSPPRSATTCRSSCCRCCTAPAARTAPCRGCSSWPTSLRRRRRARIGALHGQAQGQGRPRRPRAPAGPVDRRPRHGGDRRQPARRRGGPAATRSSSSRPTSARRSASAGAVDEAALVDAVGAGRHLRRVDRGRGGAHGREIEVAVLGNASPRASVPGEIIPGHEFYDYEDKYLDGAADLVIPADLPDGGHRGDPARSPWRRSRCSAATAWPASTSSTRKATEGCSSTR